MQEYDSVNLETNVMNKFFVKNVATCETESRMAARCSAAVLGSCALTLAFAFAFTFAFGAADASADPCAASTKAFKFKEWLLRPAAEPSAAGAPSGRAPTMALKVSAVVASLVDA